ncbi:MAG: bifunctional riboflavin kinase/FAD synthetase [Blastocatellia bacterium]|nr:bifunctional riboflavin kinase/FAD synthetase [Blastocatellia bacterium]
MKIFHETDSEEIRKPTIITLGIFDGLHLGHQLIMKKVVERAKSSNIVPTVVTFFPHPRAVLHPETAPPLLHTFDQKVEGMEFLGIEQIVVIPFTKEFAVTSAEEFTKKVLVEKLQAKEVYLGTGFAFGHGREGNIDKLKEFSQKYGFLADEAEEVQLHRHRISSTLIRQFIKEGRMSLARRMLGRFYGVEGVVIEGRKLASKLNFPTANLIPHNSVLPKDGVYVTLTLVDGIWRRSVTNVGVKPTVTGDNQRLVESHILNFNASLYNKTIRLRFLHRIRDERKFPSIDLLREQIGRDCERAKRYFQNRLVKKLIEFE